MTVGTDAISLPNPSLAGPDAAFLSPPPPAPPGTVYERDARGFVLATASGTVLPDGLVVYAGRPTVEPPPRPDFGAQAAAEDTGPAATTSVADGPPVAPISGLPLAGFRPQARPQNATEQIERLALGGLTRGELAVYRPRARPTELVANLPTADQGAIEDAIAGLAAPDADATELAVAASLRPGARPRNFAQVVSAVRQPPAPAAAPATVAPSGPIPGGVARAATEDNVLALREIALIGVFGATNARSALVRMATGRVVKVAVGDTLDGGRVSAIGDSSLSYVKRGRTITLQMPAG